MSAVDGCSWTQITHHISIKVVKNTMKRKLSPLFMHLPIEKYGDPPLAIAPQKTFWGKVQNILKFGNIQKSRPKNVIFKLFRPLGGPPVKTFAKNDSKRLVTPEIKKSLPFEPQKIAFKMIYWHFSLGGVCWTPPFVSKRVKMAQNAFQKQIFFW